MTNKQHYDLIVSLGANCSAAHNLRYRNMRPYSLPLDWTYIENDKPMKWLANAFKTKFADFFQYENLKQLPATTEHEFIYKDTKSGFVFPNHFEKQIQSKADYNVVANKMHRRINRLFKKIDSAKSILFIIASNQVLKNDNIFKIYNQLIKLYPDKTIKFEVMMFSGKTDTDATVDNIHIRTFKRPQNNYDFSKTNFEWAFLDEIEISEAPARNKIKILSFKIFHRKYKLELSWKQK